VRCSTCAAVPFRNRFALVLLTIALLVYSHRGWTVAKEAADASKVSADAAKKSAEVAADSLRHGAAAYMKIAISAWRSPETVARIGS
jgi:hypothetical protein